MLRGRNIDSLSSFKRDTVAYLRRLQRSGEPHVLTVKGKARLVVLDVEAYDRLVAEADHSAAAPGILRGLESVDRGEGRPAAEAIADLRRRMRIRKVS